MKRLPRLYCNTEGSGGKFNSIFLCTIFVARSWTGLSRGRVMASRNPKWTMNRICPRSKSTNPGSILFPLVRHAYRDPQRNFLPIGLGDPHEEKCEEVGLWSAVWLKMLPTIRSERTCS